jgi:hypothetical protein
MDIPSPRSQYILTGAIAALLLGSLSDRSFAPQSEPYDGGASTVSAWGGADPAPQLDRSRKGDRLLQRPAGQVVNTTFIPRILAPAVTFPDMDDREHVPARGPAPLADCVGQASPAADAIMGRDISSCFV